MLDIKNFSVQVWSDRSTFRGSDVERRMIRFSFGVKEPVNLQGKKGLEYVDFYMTEEEFDNVVRNGGGNHSDGYNKLDAAGDRWTFFRFDMSFRFASGVCEVPFFHMNFPRFVQRLILKAARKLWTGIETNKDNYSRPRINMDISPKLAARWERLYGQGKGEVELVADDRTIERIVECDRDSRGCDNSFDKMFERVVQIAKNTTNGFHQTAKVVMSKDYADFYWVAKAPDGRSILSGGIVNHGRSGPPDYSIHT